MGKVRVSDVISVQTDISLKKKIDAFEQICHDTVTCVICERRTTKILVVVQLIQPESAIKKAIHMGFLDKTFKTANVPCIKFYKSSHYEVNELRQAVSGALLDVLVSQGMGKALAG